MRYEMLYSGPLLFKTKISQEHIDQVKDLFVLHKSVAHNEALAGIIEQEYKIENRSKLCDILNPYLDAFLHAYKEWYGRIVTVKMHSAWVNIMKAGECNPPHIHTQCDFSSVFYTDIPKGLKKEAKSYINNGTKPGEILFNLYPGVENFITQYSSLPEVGDFYVFPAQLVHSVNTFKSKGNRVSVACNFKLGQ